MTIGYNSCSKVRAWKMNVNLNSKNKYYSTKPTTKALNNPSIATDVLSVLPLLLLALVCCCCDCC